MTDFKKGDWVRRIKDSTWPLDFGEKDKVYKVLSVSDFGDPVFIDGMQHASKSAFEPWTPRVGERVQYRNKKHGQAIVKEVLQYGLVLVDTESEYGICTESLTSLEPITDALPVAEQPAADPLSITAGKFYRTRDGRKVGPMELFEHNLYRDTVGNGVYWSRGGKGHGDSDIVAEWVEDSTSSPVAAAASNNNEQKPKSKVGDVVECLKDRYGQFTKGRLYAVRKDFFGHRGETVAVISDDEGRENGWLPEFFRLAKLMQPVFGGIASTLSTHIVCRLDNGQPLPSGKPFVHRSQEAAEAEANRLAGIHVGKEFAVFSMGAVHKVEKTYAHEWQRLAVKGEKFAAIKELRGITGMYLVDAKDSVEKWLRKECA